MSNADSPVILAVCTSKLKGTVKTSVDKIQLRKDYGVEDDAHAGEGLRQVSLLASESVDKLKDKIPLIEPGSFAENILTAGICLHELPIGTVLRIADVYLEVTQIGKECHNSGCPIKQQTGDCVMPREGIFATVQSDGVIKPGDLIEVERTDDKHR